MKALLELFVDHSLFLSPIVAAFWGLSDVIKALLENGTGKMVL